MEKIFVLLLAAILSNVCCARQTGFSRFSGLSNNKLSMPVYNIDKSTGVKVGLANDININATRNFYLKYSAAKEISWINTSEGPIAYFTMNGMKMKQAFTRNGKFDYLILYYHEKDLPKNVRHLVKREYYDFEIFLVIEIQQQREKVYVIKLQSKDQLKTVKISNGEMEIIEEYIRSN